MSFSSGDANGDVPSIVTRSSPKNKASKWLIYFIYDSCIISQMEKQKLGLIFFEKTADDLSFLFCRDLIHQIHLIKDKINKMWA